MTDFLENLLMTYRSSSKSEDCSSLEFKCLQSICEIFAITIGETISRKLWKKTDLSIVRTKEDKQKMLKANKGKHANVVITVKKCQMCMSSADNNGHDKELSLKIQIENMSNYLRFIGIGDIIDLEVVVRLKSFDNTGLCFLLDKVSLIESYRDRTNRLVKNLTAPFLGTMLFGVRQWIGSEYRKKEETKDGSHDVGGIADYAVRTIFQYNPVALEHGDKHWFCLSSYEQFV